MVREVEVANVPPGEGGIVLVLASCAGGCGFPPLPFFPPLFLKTDTVLVSRWRQDKRFPYHLLSLESGRELLEACFQLPPGLTS